MPRSKYPSLRKLLIIGTVFPAALVVTLSIAIVLLTNALHSANIGMGQALTNVRLLERTQTDLLARDRAQNPASQATLDSRIVSSLARVESSTASGQGALELAEAARQVSLYLNTPNADVMPAFQALGRVIGTSVEQAEGARADADYWNQIGKGLSLTAAVFALFGLLLALHRSSRAVVQPLSRLTVSVREFGAGKSEARAAIEGVEELREIALRFNDMASTQARRREALLTYVASVAHDLRNPIAALRLSTQSISANRPLPSEERIRRTRRAAPSRRTA